ncbi:hypothetical protein Tco_0920834 [Tanacetum coccineum]
MGDENPIRTLGDYSRPSHEGYRNTIELPDVNNVVPVRSYTICGPYDTQYCMENPVEAFVEYASLRIDEVGEQNRNPSSPKRVHFVNSIIILNKEDEAKEVGSLKSSVTKNKDHEMTVESEEEFKEETDEETEEELAFDEKKHGSS